MFYGHSLGLMGPPSDAPKIVGPRLLRHKAITTYPLFLSLLKETTQAVFKDCSLKVNGSIMLLDIQENDPTPQV